MPLKIVLAMESSHLSMAIIQVDLKTSEDKTSTKQLMHLEATHRI